MKRCKEWRPYDENAYTGDCYDCATDPDCCPELIMRDICQEEIRGMKQTIRCGQECENREDEEHKISDAIDGFIASIALIPNITIDLLITELNLFFELHDLPYVIFKRIKGKLDFSLDEDIVF